MSMHNIFLSLPGHHNNRVCNQGPNKAVLAPISTSPTKKFKFIKPDFPNLALLTRGNLAQELKTRISIAQGTGH